MPKLYRNRQHGGLFRLNDDTTITIIVRPDWSDHTHTVWTNPDLRFTKSMVESHFCNPRAGLDGVFRFKNKLFVKLGVGPDGFQQVRSLDNLDVYVRPIE